MAGRILRNVRPIIQTTSKLKQSLKINIINLPIFIG